MPGLVRCAPTRGSTAVLEVLIPSREAPHAVLPDGGDPAARGAVHNAIAAA
jgi:hypothetical protein